jgi:hypothetical protein
MKFNVDIVDTVARIAVALALMRGNISFNHT